MVLGTLVPFSGSFSPIVLITVVAVGFAALVGCETLVDPWVDSPTAPAEA